MNLRTILQYSDFAVSYLVTMGELQSDLEMEILRASELGLGLHSLQSCGPVVGSGMAQRSLSVEYTGGSGSRVGRRGQLRGYSQLVWRSTLHTCKKQSIKRKHLLIAHFPKHIESYS